MKYETIKTFVLVILVCLSLFLSFVMWSYQPNYDSLSNPDYVNEVDLGGGERTKAELIEPVDIVFHTDAGIFGFKRPMERRLFFKEIGTWVLYNQTIRESQEIPKDNAYVELVFPDAIPAEVMTNLFTSSDTIDPPIWSFDRMFITLDNDAKSLKLIIQSIDKRMELTAIIEKTERYNTVLNYLSESELLEEYITFGDDHFPIYLPKAQVDMTEKTLVATMTRPEMLINALFPDPSIVTHNTKEAYFTDGQRGMKIDQDKHNLEFISPLQPNYERLDPIELFNNSINQINEHKGWTDDYQFDEMDRTQNSISYRLYYEGYPIFTGIGNAEIEQQWKGNDLHLYARPLARIGNLLSSHQVKLPTGEEIVTYLTESSNYDIEKIGDIKLGYMMRHLQESPSLILEPKWYLQYEGEWKQLNIIDEINQMAPTGGD